MEFSIAKWLFRHEDDQTILVVSAIVMEADMYDQRSMTYKSRLQHRLQDRQSLDLFNRFAT
jgi:hypothetical protein